MATGFDHQPEGGVLSEWSLSVSGYDDGILNGQIDTLPPHGLAEVEIEIRTWEEDYEDDTGAFPVRIRGGYGWREFVYDNGAVHRYEWAHVLLDIRCRLCKRPEIARVYMVTDELWESSGLKGWPCWRCFEKAIGRRLVPTDFQPGIPCNSEEGNHEPELRARMGLT